MGLKVGRAWSSHANAVWLYYLCVQILVANLGVLDSAYSFAFRSYFHIFSYTLARSGVEKHLVSSHLSDRNPVDS